MGRSKILKFSYDRHPQAFTGADLINRFKTLALGVYPALDQLEDEGLIYAFWSGEAFPRKRMYALTKQGLPVAASYALSPFEGLPQP